MCCGYSCKLCCYNNGECNKYYIYLTGKDTITICADEVYYQQSGEDDSVYVGFRYNGFTVGMFSLDQIKGYALVNIVNK